MLRSARTYLSSLPDHPRRAFLLFWLLATLLYLPAWRAGFGADFHGWLQMYYGQSFGDAINRKTASIHSLYQLTQLQLYGLTALFGTHPLPWFLLFTALHALVATLLGLLCKEVFTDFGLRAARWVALLAALLFLQHPSNTEIVVWKASYHYFIGLLIMLCILRWLRRCLITRSLRPALLAGILFAAATFTLETFYAIPWMVLLMCVAYRLAGIVPPKNTTGALKSFFLPQLVLFGLHLLLYHAMYGVWLAHGAYTTSGKAGWQVLAGRIWSYEYHGLFLGRWLPEGARQWVYNNLEKSPGAAGYIAGFLSLFVIVALLRYKSWSPRVRILTLLAGWALLTLGLVLHFMLPDLFLIWNDRYLYFTLAFQCPVIAVLAGALLPRRAAPDAHGLRSPEASGARLRKPWLAVAVAGAALVLYTSVTWYTVLQWRQATKIFWALQQKARWKDAPAVIILNLPTWYNGVILYPAEVPESLNEHLKIFSPADSLRGKAYDVAGYNMTGRGDGAHVTVLDATHLKVTLNEWGTWWWRGTFGAANYENELYKADFTDPGHEYVLELKSVLPGMIIVYQQGDEWRVVDMGKLGVEQK